MTDVTENYFKFEVRAVVRFFQAQGLRQSEKLHRLVNAHSLVSSRMEASVVQQM
jgi:hypothetical protein